MEYQTIQLECLGQVATMRMNRPDTLNAISHEMMDEIVDGLSAMSTDTEIRVVVLCGAGSSFSAGYDIASDEGWNIGSPVQRLQDLRPFLGFARQIWSFPKPLIASVHGYCLAGACEIAMLCDLTIAASDSRFGEPENRFSSGPPVLIMPWVLGIKATKELLLTGKLIDADRAMRLGMVNEVVAPEDLARRTNEYAQVMATVAPAAVQLQKLAINNVYETQGLASTFAFNSATLAILESTETEEMQRFNEIRCQDGLKAALAWRDDQFAAAESER